jgi:hypothetical protein
MLLILGLALAAGLAVLLLLPPGEVEPADAGPVAPMPPSANGDDRDAAPEPTEPPELSDNQLPAPPSPVDGVIEQGEYPHSVEIAGVTVYWGNDAETLRMGLVSPGLGYVSIGLDPERRMEGANFILGAVREGWGAARDDWGTGPVAHGPDVDNGGTDDILEWDGSENDEGTVFEFVIPLDSGDPADKPLRPGETYAVLAAYHASDDSFGARHTERGAGEITLDPAP